MCVCKCVCVCGELCMCVSAYMCIAWAVSHISVLFVCGHISVYLSIFLCTVACFICGVFYTHTHTHTHTSRETHTHSKASVFAGLYRKVNICINKTVECVWGWMG